MDGETAVGGWGQIQFSDSTQHFAQGGDEFLRFLKDIQINVGNGHIIGVALLQKVVDVACEI